MNKADRHSPRTTVVWLVPAGGPAPVQVAESPQQHPSLTQRDKNFTPHLLVVQVGTVVDFPNHDPFFHNVFSLFEGKRFDLGLYEAGTTRYVRFDRPGICYIFCNIHPEMSAVVVVLDTPYYAIANARGNLEFRGVPPGRYTLHVWDERSLPENLAKLSREVSLSKDQESLGTIRIKETSVVTAHKNKYGRDYDKPAPSTPGYIPQ
jgi:plastocyanin